MVILLFVLALPTFAFAQGQPFPKFPSLTPPASPTLPSPPALSPEQIEKGEGLLRRQELQLRPPEKPPEAVPPGLAPPPPPEEKLSPFEVFVRGEAPPPEAPPPPVSTDIRQFGYDLFRTLPQTFALTLPQTFAPVDTVPVGPDYLLGPGDEIRITLWGKVSMERTDTIDREGKISFPEVGVLNLAGLTFSETKAFLEKELSRIYKPSEVKMNVSLGRLRTIRVFVVGKAKQPGSYTISSLSTLISGLFAAGGPSKSGTMRDIQVNRNGKTVVHFDLYDFLLKGEKTNDIKLMPEDAIFIPTIGPLVGVAGNVQSPAIYELKGETGLQSVIDMAGGLNDIAFRGRVQIDRVIENNQQVVLETTLDEIKEKELKVQPGDIVKVFPIVQDKRVVRLSGAVQREGEYGMRPGMTVKGLLAMAGGLKYYAYTKEAELMRIAVTPEGPRAEKVLVAGFENSDILLKENDYLFVRTVPEWDLYRTITIKGEVRFPGTYSTQKGETLSSLIERAGGFTEKAYLKGATFTRESVRELQQRQLDESIDRLEQQILSRSAATVALALSPETIAQQEASLEQRRGLVAKMRVAKAKGRISIDLDPLDKFRGSPSDLTLEEGDTLTVPEKPQQVQVVGAVYNQTSFVFEPKATVAAYIERAGGMTEGAQEEELYVLKVNGTAISKRQAGFFSTSLAGSRLDPGDTIVVPEKIERIAWLREVKDLTQILYQVAVTAGVLILAF